MLLSWGLQVLTKDDPSLWPQCSPAVQVCQLGWLLPLLSCAGFTSDAVWHAYADAHQDRAAQLREG